MRTGLPLRCYRLATTLFRPAVGLYLRRRLRRGKEEADRLPERRGIARQPRPPGPLAWVHGASIGESLAVLPLVEALAGRGLTVLVTTGTVTSARLLASRLPPGAIHGFVPLDVPAYAARFLDHWRPDLALFAESELWPNLLTEARRRGVPLALVNARLSSRSFRRWQRAPGLIGEVLRCATLVLAQGPGDAERLAALGAPRVAVPGNLKFDALPPPADPAPLATLRAAIGDRPAWLAASTHADEEPLLLAVHRGLAARMPGLLTVIVPRQPGRGEAIRAAAAGLGIAAGLRSAGDPVGAAPLYVADTVGELGLFFRALPLVFMGKSLAGGGGQNPIEPARLGCAVLHGPLVANFPDTYALLDEAGGAELAGDAAVLEATLHRLLHDPEAVSAMAARAGALVDAQAGATARTLALLEPLLPAPSR